MSLDKFIVKSIGFNNCDVSKSVHVAFCCTADYVRYAGVVIFSALNSSKRNFTFHIFSKDFFDSDKSKMQHMAKKYKCNIFLHFVNDEDLLEYNDPGEFSYASYYRLFIPEFLGQYTDKFIYTDVDVCFLKDIGLLYDIDLKDYCAGVVEIQGDGHKSESKRVGVSRYFASGGMLININKWIENKINDKIINELKQGINFKFPDMDILNIVLEEQVLFLDEKYQYQYSIAHSIDNVDNPQDVAIPYDVVIFHYTGSIKPWHILAKNFKVAMPFLEVKQKSLWNEVPLVNFRSYKEYHKAARLAKKQGSLKDMLYFYVKYSYEKIKKFI